MNTSLAPYVAYIAHPLGQGPDREANRQRASRWVAWAVEVMGVVPIADWIILSGQWDESKRDLGLAVDMHLVDRSDAVWLVGGRVSPGMALEARRAQSVGGRVVDLTFLGEEPYPNGIRHEGLDLIQRLRRHAHGHGPLAGGPFPRELGWRDPERQGG